MKREKKATFSAMLWKCVSYVEGSDFEGTNTLKVLDFVPDAGTYVRTMTLWAMSCPQGEKEQKKKKKRKRVQQIKQGPNAHMCAIS